jgi:outer membrane protein
MTKKISFILLLFIGGNSYAADSTFTLKQCIEYAWLNNPDVKQAILNDESGKVDVLQSKTNLLPSVSASAGQNYQFGRTIDRFTNSFINQTIRSNNISLSGNMVIFNGLQNQNSIKRQNEIQKSNDENIENVKNQIALSVSSAFLQVIQSVESINNAKFQIESTKQRIIRAEKQVEAGASDLSTLLSLKAQLANEELNLVNAENTRSSSLLNLRTLMQVPMEDDFDVLIPEMRNDLMVNALTAVQIYEIAVGNMPEIKSAMHQVEAAKFQTKISQGNFSPTIALFGSVSTVYSQNSKSIVNVTPSGTQVVGFTQTNNDPVLQPTFSYETKTIAFNQQLKDNLGQSLGVSLSWNLFSGMQVHNQIKKSKIQEEINHLNLLRTKNTLLSDINLAVNNYNAAKSKYDASVNNVNAQKNSFEYVQKRFDAGVSTSFDFIQAKNNYLQAVSSEIQARYELVFRGLILEYYKGNPLIL